MPITTNLPHEGAAVPPGPSTPAAESIETTLTWAHFMRESKMPVDRDSVGMADLGKQTLTGQRRSLY